MLMGHILMSSKCEIPYAPGATVDYNYLRSDTTSQVIPNDSFKPSVDGTWNLVSELNIEIFNEQYQSVSDDSFIWLPSPFFPDVWRDYYDQYYTVGSVGLSPLFAFHFLVLPISCTTFFTCFSFGTIQITKSLLVSLSGGWNSSLQF